MSNSKKYEIISTKGKYIVVSQYYNYSINLYLLDDAFYELWYFGPTNEIEKIEVLDDEKKIDLYIQHMNQLDQTHKENVQD